MKIAKNWKILLKEYSHKIGSTYKDTETGIYYNFLGLLHGEDDYYYVMYSKHKLKYRLLSCVGNIESFGLEEVK